MSITRNGLGERLAKLEKWSGAEVISLSKFQRDALVTHWLATGSVSMIDLSAMDAQSRAAVEAAHRADI